MGGRSRTSVVWKLPSDEFAEILVKSKTYKEVFTALDLSSSS
jgi:hypothetical protein